MLQDIYPYIFNNSFEISGPREDDFLVLVKERRILLKNADEPIFPTVKNLKRLPEDCFYLFAVSGVKFYALPDRCEEELLAGGFVFTDQNTAARKQPKHLGFAAAVAVELCDWYQKNRFCGKCGEKTVPDTKERMLRCPCCGNLIYPRINPVMITAVTDGDKLLMTKYAGRLSAPRYALVAGFTEIGESIEDTVRREVLEETGVHVKEIRFYKSQPWPLSGSLLLGFVCTADSSEPIVMQEDELGFAGWIHRKDITQQDDGFSLTSEMIRAFAENRL